MSTLFIIFIGAGLGGLLRHVLNEWVTRLFGSDFPWGILFVNVLGCLIMGLVIGWLAYRGSASQPVRLFLTTGIIGGFTTFSTFSLDAVLLAQRGQLLASALYVAASIGLSVGALLLAMSAVRALS